MAEGKGPLSQILVAVAIAFLVGGTAPWWWQELKDWLRPAAERRKAAERRVLSRTPAGDS
jgi:hypothetical protein